jgi:drug/metabolite transporter (DMT)-like permease
VNPLVAVILGYFFGGEDLGPRVIVGSACVLASVVMITTGKSGAMEVKGTSTKDKTR